jgi:UDP-glucose 4-epimerase
VFHELDGFSSLSLRLANVYGPRQDPHGEAGVVAIFCEALLQHQTPTINGDGLQTRDYVYVGDVVEAFMAALERDVQGAINIGTGVETNVNDLYALIARAASSAAEPQHGPAKPGEQRRSCLDIQNAQQSLGWSPRVGLEAGIGKTVDWFRAHGT